MFGFWNEQIPEDYYFKGDRVYSDGFFIGYGIEGGYSARITQRLGGEIGLQWGQEIHTTKRQVSNSVSILPGLGAWNFVGYIEGEVCFGSEGKS